MGVAGYGAFSAWSSWHSGRDSEHAPQQRVEEESGELHALGVFLALRIVARPHFAGDAALVGREALEVLVGARGDLVEDGRALGRATGAVDAAREVLDAGPMLVRDPFLEILAEPRAERGAGPVRREVLVLTCGRGVASTTFEPKTRAGDAQIVRTSATDFFAQ